MSGYDILVKPVFDNGGGGLVVDKPGKYIIRDPNGNILETVNATGRQGEHGIKAQSKAIAGGLPAGSSIEFEGNTYQLTGGGARHEFTYGNSKPSLVSSKGAIGSRPAGAGGGYQPGSTFGGGFAGGQAAPTFVDGSTLAFPMVMPQPIPQTQYQPIDPRVYAQTVAPLNRMNYIDNLQLSQMSALGFSNTEAAVNQRFGPQQSALQMGMAAAENQFNQGQVATANQFNPSQVSTANRFNRSELSAAIDESGIPVKELIDENLTRTRQLSKGFLPTTIEDRAYEMAARSKAGDALVAKGMGTASFMQNAIDKYTIGERLGLMQQGSADASNWLNMGVKLLVDAPVKYNPLLSSPLTAKTSQDIRGVTSFSPGAAQQAEQANLSNLTTMNPAQSLQLYNQDRQFTEDLFTRINMFNSTQGVGVQQFNATGNFQQQLTQLNVDQNNAAAAWQFSQNVANQVNAQYQQQLANYAYSQGYGQAATSPTVLGNQQSGVAPTAPLSANPNASNSTVFRQ